MRIHVLRLSNFRGFEQIELRLHERFTLLIGPNTSGKTALLDGLAIALGAWLGGTAQASGEDRPIRRSDARLVRQEQEGFPTLNPSFPVRVEAEGTVQGKRLGWTRELRRPRGRTTWGGASELRRLAAETERLASRDPSIPLPVLAYYGTGRLWVQRRERSAPGPLGSRMQGYASCLSTAQDVHLFERWMAWREQARLQRIAEARDRGQAPEEVESPQLDAVSEAAAGCLEGARRLYYSVNHRELRLELEDGSFLPFSALSDGQRGLLMLAADIAWRAVQLNPQFGREAPRRAEGVVLIDEIELHLHPAWQHRVLEDLGRSFPGIQFVITTHSPQVVANARPEWMRLLLPDGISRVEHVRGKDSNSVLRELMGAPERPPWMERLLARLESAIEQGRLEEARRLLDEARADLGANDPAMIALEWELHDHEVHGALD